MNQALGDPIDVAGERPKAVPPARSNARRWLIAAALAFLTALLYLPAARHDFVFYDDDQYVTNNPDVLGGLTVESVRWAFGSFYASNWHPLTWLSHMLDCQLWGTWAGGHHLTNIVLHALNAALLFLVLEAITGARARSAVVAALFAWHPLHVESVAWVAERKDVLSTFFWLLALAAYARYARARLSPGRAWVLPYLLVVLFFVLGLLAKPMLVTFPFVLLLLDYWPLRRFGQTGLRAFPMLVLEKLPFFVLSAVSCVVTFFAQRAGGAVKPFDALPLALRAANSAVSYLRYAGKAFWPTDLAVFYPFPDAVAQWLLAVAVAFLAGITLWAILSARRLPWFPVGWFWYLGTLVPVIGIIQVGDQGIADRYTYVPFIGLFLVVTWGFATLAERWRWRKAASIAAASLVLAASALLTAKHLPNWKNSDTLFNHTIAVSPHSPVAHNNLATYLDRQGKVNLAIAHCLAAVRLKPTYMEAHNNLAVLLQRNGRTALAVDHYERALRLNPNYPDALSNLGNIYLERGELEKAIELYQRAVRAKPAYAEAHNNLGAALSRQEKFDEAIGCFREALRLKPSYMQARKNLANTLIAKGSGAEAVEELRKALEISPDDVWLLWRLSWLRATYPNTRLRDGAEALHLAEKAERLTRGRDVGVLDALAAAQAESGLFDEAAETANRAVTLCGGAKPGEYSAEVSERGELYLEGFPYREPLKPKKK